MRALIPGVIPILEGLAIVAALGLAVYCFGGL